MSRVCWKPAAWGRFWTPAKLSWIRSCANRMTWSCWKDRRMSDLERSVGGRGVIKIRVIVGSNLAHSLIMSRFVILMGMARNMRAPIGRLQSALTIAYRRIICRTRHFPGSSRAPEAKKERLTRTRSQFITNQKKICSPKAYLCQKKRITRVGIAGSRSRLAIKSWKTN